MILIFLSKKNPAMKKIKKTFRFEPNIDNFEGDFYLYLLTLHQHGIPILDVGIDKMDQKNIWVKKWLTFIILLKQKKIKEKMFLEDIFAYGDFEYIRAKDIKMFKDKKIQTLISALKNIEKITKFNGFS